MGWAKEGRIEAGGLSLAFLEAGEGRGLPPVLLIHGAGGSRKSWLLLMRRLAGFGLRAVALELPGHGKSGKKDGQASIEGYACAVWGFIEAMGFSRPVVAGHSMGGAIALEMGLSEACELSGLVLIGTGARLRVQQEILDGIRADFGGAVKCISGFAYSGTAPPELVAEGERQLLECPPEVLGGDFRACDAFDVSHRIGEIGTPVLIICGEEDILTPPRYSQFLAEKIPGARLELIERAGHMVMVERPRPVGEAIREFVGGG